VVAIGTTSRFTKLESAVASERRMVADQSAAEDDLVRCCERAGVLWTLLRPTLVYDGIHDRNVAFVAACIRRFGCFPVVGAGQGKRQPLHAEDLALACVDVISKSATENRAYNLSGGETLSYRQMVERVFDAYDLKPRILTVPPIALRAAIATLRMLPRFRYLNKAMVFRMEEDLVFDQSDAVTDFGFAPRRFKPRAT